jgi:aryl-alcohol dehydrogenase-like predicted oxidoreductase
MQTRYSLAYREEEREMIPLCADQGVGVLPYSPLARGLLAGTRKRSGHARTPRAASEQLAGSVHDDNDFDVADALETVAGRRAQPPAVVALAWLLGKAAVGAPIIGATRPEHVDDALTAVDLDLNAEETGALEAPYRPHVPYGYT